MLRDEKLLSYIADLSESDTKNLSQRGLKTSEEVGELSKCILPYDNAYATTHRFVARQAVLEEAVDTILCAMSVVQNIGCSWEEAEQMMWRKAQYWDKLQVASRGIDPNKIPFEIHITIKSGEVEKFKEDCRSLGVKPLMIDLHTKGGIFQDLQTSSDHVGSNRTCYEEVERIANGLTAKGYTVVRRKVETVPWHPAAPSVEGQEMPKDCYFEAHIPVIIPDTEKDLEKLSNFVGAYDARTSRNAFKKMEGGLGKMMVTLRRYEGYTGESFSELLREIEDVLKAQEYVIEKCIIEFSIYDSKVSHDSAWINLK